MQTEECAALDHTDDKDQKQGLISQLIFKQCLLLPSTPWLRDEHKLVPESGYPRYQLFSPLSVTKYDQAASHAGCHVLTVTKTIAEYKHVAKKKKNKNKKKPTGQGRDQCLHMCTCVRGKRERLTTAQ